MAACRLRYRAASQCRAGLRRGRALWPWPAAGLRQYICPRRRAGLPGRAAIVPAAGYRLEAGGGLHRGADRPHCGPPAGPDRLFARRGLRGGRSAVGTGACHPGGRRKPGGYGQPAVLRRAGRAGGAGHPQAPHRHPARSLPVGRHGRRLFAARCPAGVCTGAGGGGVLHFVLCLRGQPGAHRRTGSCTCHGPDRCRPGALFCRAGRGCGRAGDSGLLPRRAPQRGRRICCRVCAGGAGRPQPDRRTHPRSCRRGRATGLSALPGAGSAGGVSAACPTGRHPKPDQRGTQTFRRGRYLIRHCRNSERCMQLPDAAPRRKL